MGKVKPGRKKSKLIKAAKSAKLDQNGTEYKEVGKSLREQIDEALEYFKSGDVPESKNIIKTVLKVCTLKQHNWTFTSPCSRKFKRNGTNICPKTRAFSTTAVHFCLKLEKKNLQSRH